MPARQARSSLRRNSGNNAPASNPAFAFPGPLYPPARLPLRGIMAPGSEVARPADAQIDIGAFEYVGDLIFANGFQL